MQQIFQLFQNLWILQKYLCWHINKKLFMSFFYGFKWASFAKLLEKIWLLRLKNIGEDVALYVCDKKGHVKSCLPNCTWCGNGFWNNNFAALYQTLWWLLTAFTPKTLEKLEYPPDDYIISWPVFRRTCSWIWIF